jgi:hypothetical protein
MTIRDYNKEEIEYKDKKAKLDYTNSFKELYKSKDEKKEEIYNLLHWNPEIMKYLTKDEKAGVCEIILNSSNNSIKNLIRKMDKLEEEGEELDEMLLKTRRELNQSIKVH